MTVANIKFIPFMETLYSTLEYRSKRIDDYATDYAMLKMLGYHDVAHHILDLLIDDPNLASYLFTIYGNLIVAPATDPMRGYHPNMCYDKEDYSRQIMTLRQSNLPTPEVERLILPSEIGKILAGKLVLHCTGFKGCISMIDRYNSQDLQELLSAIQVGCERTDIDFVVAKSHEVEVFDNIWNDANKISDAKKGIDYGVLMSIGLVGYFLTLPLGGIGGILASLGFDVLEKHVNPKISGRLARFLYSNWLVSIFDFKERHHLLS